MSAMILTVPSVHSFTALKRAFIYHYNDRTDDKLVSPSSRLMIFKKRLILLYIVCFVSKIRWHHLRRCSSSDFKGSLVVCTALVVLNQSSVIWK
jgi:hypothetical protein